MQSTRDSELPLLSKNAELFTIFTTNIVNIKKEMQEAKNEFLKPRGFFTELFSAKRIISPSLSTMIDSDQPLTLNEVIQLLKMDEEFINFFILRLLKNIPDSAKSLDAQAINTIRQIYLPVLIGVQIELDNRKKELEQLNKQIADTKQELEAREIGIKKFLPTSDLTQSAINVGVTAIKDHVAEKKEINQKNLILAKAQASGQVASLIQQLNAKAMVKRNNELQQELNQLPKIKQQTAAIVSSFLNKLDKAAEDKLKNQSTQNQVLDTPAQKTSIKKIPNVWMKFDPETAAQLAKNLGADANEVTENKEAVEPERKQMGM
jgi:hypothetical protein